MKEILKRLEIIKSGLEIRDMELVEFQLKKLSELDLNEQIQMFINRIKNQDYSVIVDIQNYISLNNLYLIYDELGLLKEKILLFKNKLDLDKLENITKKLTIIKKEKEDISIVIDDLNNLLNDLYEYYKYYVETESILKELKNKISQLGQEENQNQNLKLAIENKEEIQEYKKMKEKNLNNFELSFEDIEIFNNNLLDKIKLLLENKYISDEEKEKLKKEYENIEQLLNNLK